jgi:hypothetical protein
MLFQHGDIPTGLRHECGGREACEAGADDNYFLFLQNQNELKNKK